MSRNLVRPFFPIPPQGYEQSYFNEVIRSFAVYLDQMQNPGEGRHTTLVLTDLPSNDSGLETGSIFVVDGVLRVPVPSKPYAASFLSTGQVGSVTVTT
jgi:hypothetical protein|tara:strand:- start:9 stop:302 length:294 start_codon:yes stop_codon:yes gene_type:complete